MPYDEPVARLRKQKTDRQDAQLLLKLLMEDCLPRIWVPDAENRDLRQLLWHRHPLVQMRTHAHHESVACDGSQRGSAAGESCGGRRVAANWNR